MLRERIRSGVAHAGARGVLFGRQPGQRVKADKLAPKPIAQRNLPSYTHRAESCSRCRVAPALQTAGRVSGQLYVHYGMAGLRT